jgi:putative zinc finger protein
MNHPHEQLVDLMDGMLDEDLLAGVLAHVETCAECRADLEAARHGREAARTLPEVDAPADLHRRVVAAAGGGGRGGAPRWYRWAGAAAAAAVVLAIAIALPDVGNDEGGVRSSSDAVAGDTAGGGAQEEAPVPASNAAGDAVRLRREDRDYDQAALQDLAAQEQQRAPVAATEDSSRPATLSSGTEDAARCVREAFDGQPTGRLIQMIEATFDGRDAYIAVHLEGPGAGQPADTVAVYAASRNGCQLLSFASALI